MYVLESGGNIIVGPVGWGTSLQEPLGLRGNAVPPVPFEGSGHVLRAYTETPAAYSDEYQETTGSTSGVNGHGVWETVQSVADMSLVGAQAVAKAAVAESRWAAETNGITHDEIKYSTDRDSQHALGLARARAKEDAAYSANWKAKEGEFVALDAAGIIALADAVAAHVESVFDKEAELVASVDAAADVDAVRLIDLKTGWPT
jgi:hypothetical protein